jgi:hypothetical protein
MRHSPEVLRRIEVKLRERGKPVPPWVIDRQHIPSCTLKIKKLGLGPVREESDAIANIERKNGEHQG